MAMNPIKQLFDYDPTKLVNTDFRCGNSKFSDLIWDFNGYVDLEHQNGARLMINFHSFAHKPQILEIVKWFMLYELITGKINTAKRSRDGLVRFIKFVNENTPELDSFADFSQDLLVAYFNYLFEAKSETHPNNNLSSISIKKAALAIRDLLMKGNVKGWAVPRNVRFVQTTYNEMILNNKALKENKLENSKDLTDKVDDSVLIDQILRAALSDIEAKINIISASAVIIFLQLGMRISELLTIRAVSLEQIGGDTSICYVTSKLSNEPIRVNKPANSLIVEAYNALNEFTSPLRKEWKGEPYLFINKIRKVKGYPTGQVAHATFNQNFLRPWIKKHNLKGKDGKLIDFTAHTFRHAFATYAIKNGMSIEVVSDMLNHESIRGTLHYTHVIQEEVKKKFGIIMDSGAILSGQQALTLKDKLAQKNPFKGKTLEHVDKLRKAMKIQILTHGLCLHHPMRNEPCEGDGVCLGCRNFLTTPDFLDVHKGRLFRVQGELAMAPSNGPFEAKLRVQESYLIGIIYDLESQMNYRGKNDNFIPQETIEEKIYE